MVKYVKWDSRKLGYQRDMFPDIVMAPCPFHESGWIIVQNGKVREPKFYKQFTAKKPHYHLTVKDKWGWSRTVSLAVLIWLYYKDQDIPAGHVIDHIDENPLNNCIGNLQCITIGANVAKGNRARKKNK